MNECVAEVARWSPGLVQHSVPLNLWWQAPPGAQEGYDVPAISTWKPSGGQEKTIFSRVGLGLIHPTLCVSRCMAYRGHLTDECT